MFFLKLPPDLLTVFVVFLFALVLFHLMLCVWWQLGKVGWKVVDYIYLSAGGLGLITAVAQSRQTFAPYVLQSLESISQHMNDPLALVISNDYINRSACVKPEYPTWLPSKPERETFISQWNSVCDWHRSVAQRLVNLNMGTTVNRENLPVPPYTTERYPSLVMTDFWNALELHNEFAARLQAAKEAKERTFTNLMVVAFSPLLLAVALALRLTKVTGELQSPDIS